MSHHIERETDRIFARNRLVRELFERAAALPWALRSAAELRARTSGPCAACGRSVQAHAADDARVCADWLEDPAGPPPIAWQSCIAPVLGPLPARRTTVGDDLLVREIERIGR